MKRLALLAVMVCGMARAEAEKPDPNKDSSVIAARKHLRDANEKFDAAKQRVLKDKLGVANAQREIDKCDEESATLQDARHSSRNNSVDNQSQLNAQIEARRNAASRKLRECKEDLGGTRFGGGAQPDFDIAQRGIAEADKELREAMRPFNETRIDEGKNDRIAAARTIFKMKDGKEVPATTVIESEDVYTIKDIDGKVRNLKRADVESVTKPEGSN